MGGSLSFLKEVLRFCGAAVLQLKIIKPQHGRTAALQHII
jgi:hypothetical protein